MSARRAIWEVARRELVERSRSRAMRISFIVVLALAVGGAVAAARLGQGTPTDDVALVGTRSVAMAPALQLQAEAAGRAVDIHRLRTVASARRAVDDGSVDVALVDGARLIVKRSQSDEAAALVKSAVAAQGALTRLESLGLTRAQAIEALTPRPLPVDLRGRSEAEQGLVYAGIMLLLLALATYGGAVASSVTEEKSSRVVELLLTTVSPRRLLTGKVLGVGALGVAQLAVTGGAALAAGRLAGGAGLPSGAAGTVALVVLWFLLGYAFYSVAFAAVGALVSRQEDLSATSAPLVGVLMGSFVLSIFALDFGRTPDSTIAQIAGFLPPTAPMIVPTRMVVGEMGAIELIVAVALELAGTALLIVVAARVYERAILRIGAPVNLGSLLGGSGAKAGGADHHEMLRGLVCLFGGGVLVLAAGEVSPIAVMLVAAGLFLVVRAAVRATTGAGPASG